MSKVTLPGRSWLAALAVAMVLGVYLLSADVRNMSDQNKSPQTADVTGQATILPTVNARIIERQDIPRTVTLYGQTRPDRVITVSAEVAARIVAVSADRGERVQESQELLRLREGTLRSELDAAEARVKKASQDLESALTLHKKNLIANNQLPQLELAVAEAEAQLDRIAMDLANTRVLSPVAGILNIRHVELGDYIDRGKPVAEILDLDPLIVSVDVSQKLIQGLGSGTETQVRVLGKPALPATIRYISRKADAATRTFAVELALDNPNMLMPAGMSVEADILLGSVRGLQISPALLSLNEAGDPGVKWVDRDNRVRFTAADIVKSDSNSIWLAGIPEDARIITRGQGFVKEGSRVVVANENANEGANEDVTLVAGD